MKNQSTVSLVQGTDLSWLQASASQTEADMEFWDYSKLFPSDEEFGDNDFSGVTVSEQGRARPHPILAQEIQKCFGNAKRKLVKGLQILQPGKTLRKQIHILQQENRALGGELVNIHTVLTKHKNIINVFCEDLEDQRCKYETETAQHKADFLSTQEMHKKTIEDLEAKLRVQKETKDADISTLRSTNRELNVANAALETEVAFLKQELHLCNVRKTQEAEHNLSQHKQLVEELKNELDVQIKQNEARAKEDQERNAAKILQLKTAFDDELMTVQAEKDEKIAAQETIIQDYTEEVTRIEARAKANQERDAAKILELETALRNLQENMATFKDEAMSIQAEQDEKIKAQETRIREYAEKVTSLDWWKQENERLEKELAEAREEISRLSSHRCEGLKSVKQEKKMQKQPTSQGAGRMCRRRCEACKIKYGSNY